MPCFTNVMIWFAKNGPDGGGGPMGPPPQGGTMGPGQQNQMNQGQQGLISYIGNT
jgi:hypothetical protein